MLIERTTELLYIKHGAFRLRTEDSSFICSAAQALSLGECPSLSLSSSTLGQLHGGKAASPVKENHFSLLVPLTAPRKEKSELAGILALGPRLSSQRYSREDRTLLTGLTDQAGTAIHVARLIQEKQAEAQRREEVERRAGGSSKLATGTRGGLRQYVAGRSAGGVGRATSVGAGGGAGPGGRQPDRSPAQRAG